MLEKAETKKGKSEKKEESLAADESKVDKQISATENLLKEGAMHPSKKKTAAGNMQEIEAASAHIERENTKLSAIKKHLGKITTVSDVLGKRRKVLFEAVIPSNKKNM